MKRNAKVLSGYDRVMRRTKIPKNKDECWLWCGPVNNAGYGMIRGNDGAPRMTTVHRVVGIHKGLNHRKEIQHTCLVKHCVNPDHLVNGVPKNRVERMMKKYDGKWQTPKEPYKICEHCGKTTYVVWFSRMHKDCYPGMNKNKTKLLNRINTKQIEV